MSITIGGPIVIGIALTIYLVGRFVFKMKGKFWITFLASIVYNTFSLWLVLWVSSLIRFSEVPVLMFIWITLTTALIILTYYLSHKQSLKRQNNAENGD